MRDVLASVLATGIATLAISYLREPAQAPQVSVTPAGKVAERLDWRNGEVPDGSPRLAETVAMFSLPQADARTWSERSVEQPQQSAQPTAAKERSGMPQIAEYEAKQQHKPVSLPPSRPVVVASAEAPVRAQPQPVHSKVPIRVLGWNIPGTDLIPSGKEALDTVVSIPGKVASVGGEAAGAVTGKVASIGGAVAETVGWR